MCTHPDPGRRGAGGATLIELVIAIVVIAAGVTAILSVFSASAARSADPMRSAQAQAVADAYLEEILLRAYDDPSPGGSEVGENRASFDDVDDYHGLGANGCLTASAACPVAGDCACDQFGDPIDALAGYRVDVAVTTTMLNTAAARRVDVTVTHARFADLRVRLTGYRTDY